MSALDEAKAELAGMLCLKTNNQWGTDTYPRGTTCGCRMCQTHDRLASIIAKIEAQGAWQEPVAYKHPGAKYWHDMPEGGVEALKVMEANSPPGIMASVIYAYASPISPAAITARAEGFRECREMAVGLCDKAEKLATAMGDYQAMRCAGSLAATIGALQSTPHQEDKP